MRRNISLIMVVFFIIFLFSTTGLAKEVTVYSKPKGSFSVTYEDTRFIAPRNRLDVNFDVKIFTNNVRIDTVRYGETYGMNYDGSIILGSYSIANYSLIEPNPLSMMAAYWRTGVEKRFLIAGSTDGDKAEYPVTTFVFYPINLIATPMSIMEGDNWDPHTTLNGTDGTLKEITASSDGVSITGFVDNEVPGVYPINFNFKDPANVYGEKDASTEITVLPKPKITPPVFPDSLVSNDTSILEATIDDSANLGSGNISRTFVQSEDGENYVIDSKNTFSPKKTGLYTVQYEYDYTKPNGDTDTVIAKSMVKVNNPSSPTISGLVSITYLDEQNNPIASKVSLTGKVGDAYSTEKLTILGYTFKEIQGSATGKFTDSEQTVTYIYQIDKITGSSTTNPNKNNQAQPQAQQQARAPISKDKNFSSSKSSKKLPATGEEQNNQLLIVGVTILITIGVSYWFKISKKK